MIANCPWLPHYSNNHLPGYHPAWCQCLVSAASSATCASARRLERSIANLTVYNSPRHSRIKSYQPIWNMQLNWNCILFAPQPLSPQWKSCFFRKLSGRVYDAARSFGWIDGLRAGDGPSLTPETPTLTDPRDRKRAPTHPFRFELSCERQWGNNGKQWMVEIHEKIDPFRSETW